MLQTLFLIIGALALLVILVIVIRKFPRLTIIDIAAIPKERELQKKNELIAARMARRMQERWQNVVDRVAPSLQGIQQRFRDFYQRIMIAEHQYQQRIFFSPEERRRRVEVLLTEALALRDEKNFTEAERRYIEIVRIDPRNTDAYHALGDLYIDAKEYDQARETFTFLLAHHERELARTNVRSGKEISAQQQEEIVALRAELAKDANTLGYCCGMLDDFESAQEAYERAVEMEPANPKYLDFLLDACILGGDKRKAQNVFAQLKEANSENQKLGELWERIKEL